MTGAPLPLLTSPSGQRMLSYLPPLYDRSRVLQSLLQAEGLELDALRAAVADLLAQFYPRTATWGLPWWEAEVGLPAAPLLADAERRDRIVAKLRGYGTATVVLLKRVAEAWDLGAVDVVEDFEAYTLHVRFVDTRGVPTNLGDLRLNVRAVAQAHLALAFLFRYLLVFELRDTGLTVADVAAMGLTVAQLRTWRP